MIPISRTMESVRPALANDVDLAARGTSKTGVIVRYANTEFVGSFDTDGDDRNLIAATGDDVVGDINSVEIECVLIAARTGNCAARVTVATAVGSFIGRGARLEGEELAGVALKRGKVSEGLTADDATHDSIGGL